MDMWLLLATILFGYCSGVATVYFYQWLERRATRTQEEDIPEGYTLTVVESPHYDEGA